ncbi:helix-turn-helix domain-containing protein [Raineyella sp. W15-4]|uniref:TetR/AcrR family transcriptional regulator n=1 Tax=Raineyella sp. W15-4 TaxID=3081651 RepID=UPI00295365C3|nr:helix-turn-helix domain-containing protein [Raineyella sp. W15-4]WOQ16849.1 helix-turn-helix domain-containing protein [Raineyella sp. W15-4]
MTRARRLPPEDRRDAIIAATGPLLAEAGPNVSTRQIAAACGIAEGTLFRVFPTKRDLLEATLRASLDPTADVDRLRAIDRAQPLETRLRQVVDILVARTRRVSGLFAALHRPARDARSARDPRTDRGTHADHDPAEHHARHGHHHGPPDLQDRQRLTTAVADVLAPDAEHLDLDPAAAASFVRSVVTAATHPILGDDQLTDPGLLAHLLLKALQKDLM